jgi:hypothetical protein
VGDTEKTPDGNLPAVRDGFAAFELAGRDPATWKEMRPRLIRAVAELVDSLNSDDPTFAWLKEQATSLSGLALDNVKARLQKPGTEVAEAQARIAKEYSLARKNNADAGAVEFNTTCRKLLLALSLSRVMLVRDSGHEALIAGQEIDALIEAVKFAQEGNKQIGAR